MAYILNKTNGVIVATVQDAALDNSTSLTFIGRNYAGYGEIQNENFVKLLENFANTAAPSKPIEGQLWFDTLNRNANVYDGITWKPLAISNVTTDSSKPNNPKLGDLWYDAAAQQLYAYNGSSFALIGPASGADLLASWKGSYEYSLEAADNVPVYNAKAVVGTDETVIAVVSDRTYTIQTSPGSESYPMAGQTQKIYKGITLAGADPITGSSISAGNYFWGTAAEALSAQTAGGFTFSSSTSSQRFNVLFAETGTSGLCYVNTGLQFNPGNQTLYAQNLIINGQSSLTTNGYTRLPGGLLMQWGYQASVVGDNYTAITFPIAFSTAVANVTASMINTNSPGNYSLSNNIAQVGTITTTGFHLINNLETSGPNFPMYWFALGY
jgi:hypothetical protein